MIIIITTRNAKNSDKNDIYDKLTIMMTINNKNSDKMIIKVTKMIIIVTKW